MGFGPGNVADFSSGFDAASQTENCNWITLSGERGGIDMEKIVVS